MISRRSLYCSKYADGKYSIVDFDDKEGNVKYFQSEHTWTNLNKCKFCGVNKQLYNKDKEYESYAYSFIHEQEIKELIDVKFDVIIVNHPYQMSDGGHKASAKPIYNLFVEKAMQLSPNYLCMIIPSRWFSGGKGLDNFRETMLSDTRIKILHDFEDAKSCFPGVEIKGGVCYFLWEKNYSGKCSIHSHFKDSNVKVMERKLLEKNEDIFIRHHESVPILKKVKSKGEKGLTEMISSRKPFGFPTNFSKYEKNGEIEIIGFKKKGFISRKKILKNEEWVDKYKVYVPYAFGSGASKEDIIKPILGSKSTCCTETYLLFGPFDSEAEARNLISYIKTRFFHFFVSLRKNTQHGTKTVYQSVPIQDFTKKWTDEKLYEKYRLTNKEIAFIEKSTPVI